MPDGVDGVPAPDVHPLALVPSVAVLVLALVAIPVGLARVRRFRRQRAQSRAAQEASSGF